MGVAAAPGLELKFARGAPRGEAGEGEGDRPLLRGGVRRSAGSTGGGGGVYSAAPRGHLTIDPGSMARPSMSRSQGGIRSRLQTEHTCRRNKKKGNYVHLGQWRRRRQPRLEAGEAMDLPKAGNKKEAAKGRSSCVTQVCVCIPSAVLIGAVSASLFDCADLNPRDRARSLSVCHLCHSSLYSSHFPPPFYVERSSMQLHNSRVIYKWSTK